MSRNKNLHTIYQREQDLNITLQSIGDGVISTDTKCRITRMNPVAAQLTGWSEKEAIGKHIHDVFCIINSKTGKIAENPTEKVLETGKIVGLANHTALISKDGKEYQIADSASPIKDEHGGTHGVILVFRDVTNEYKQEQLLKESEEKYRNFFYTSKDSVFITSKDGKFIELNDAAVKTFGYDSFQDLKDINVKTLYKNPKDREEHTRTIIQQGYTKAYPIDLVRKDGSIIHTLISSVPVKDKQGNVTGFQGTIKDITEREKQKQRIQHLNSVLRAIRNVNQLIIREKDKQTLIKKSCKTLTETRGFSNAWIALFNGHGQFILAEESGMGKDFNTLKKQMKEGFLPQCVEKCINKKKMFSTTKDCSDCPVSTSYYDSVKIALPLLYQDNFFGTLTISAPEKVLHDNEELSLIKEVAADISFALHNIELERKHQEANKELIESENKFRTLVENAFDAIYLMSGRRYEYVNSRFCEITGYSAEELKSPDFDFEILLTDSSKEIVEKRYKARERGEEVPNQYEIELETKYGDIKYVEMSTFGMHDNNNVKVLGVMRETTQRKKAENEMMKAKEKAEESDRLKSAFLANMSHEIRTPMNGIVGFTQLLRNQNLPKQKQEKFLDIIDSRSKHLLQLIDDIIDISKIEANLFKIEYNKCSVNQLMDELFDSYQQELKNKNKHKLELKVNKTQDNIDAMVTTDEVRLRQVLTNLLSNAIKYSHSGTIEFGYNLKNDHTLEFYVMDEGEGIPKEKQKLIFNRFRQADEKTAQKFGGAGLGLAISKSIVEKMGGKIWVKSQVSKGSTFYFTIPYYNVKEHEEDQNKKIGPSKNEDWSKHTIMIVEDDTVSQEYLKELLYDTGTNLLYADSGQQCFDLLKKEENKPSLILMDLQLPDISGLEITKKIRTENQEIPIIAQTAFAMEEDKIQAMESGCNDFISKPIDQEKFLGLIKKYLMKA